MGHLIATLILILGGLAVWRICQREALNADRLEPGALIYVAGPFTGYTDELGRHHSVAANIDAAEVIGKVVRSMGFIPFVPHLAIPDPGPGRKGWAVAMRECLVHLAGTDATLMMAGWQHSEGARIEHTVTREGERRVYYSVGELAAKVRDWRDRDPVYAARLDAYQEALSREALAA